MHNHCQIQQREITQKLRKAELSFLYVTSCLILFYISTKYQQNTPKVFKLQITEPTQTILKTKQK